MTCIVGIVDDNKDVLIGADSAGVAGYSLIIRADEKVFINDGYIFGCCGSHRMLQLLRYSFKPPKYYGDADINSFMATTFINAVRECFKTGGFAHKKDEVESMGNSFIVGVKGNLFIVYSDYQIASLVEKYAAIGSGEDIANGSLFTSDKFYGETNDEERVEMALEAAEHFNAGVRGPFKILRLKNE